MADELEALIGADVETVRELLAAADHDELRRNLTPDAEAAILEDLFRRFPEYLDAERTTHVEESFAWHVAGRRWVVTIDRGRALVAEGDGPARVSLTLDTVDLLGLVTGTADAAHMFFTGRLRLRGDEAFVLELASYFRAPTETGEVLPSGGDDDDRMARLIGSVPERDLRERLQGGMRDVILGEVFARFPDYLRADDVTATIKWSIKDAGRYLVHIDRGTCEVTEDTGERPRVTLKLDATDFLRLVTGNANPTMLLLRRRLTVKGDLGFAAALPRLFRMPTGREE